MNGQDKDNSPQLWELTYRDNDIHLVTYADTLAYDCKDGANQLIAARFGGYPEQVRAMAAAIYGGGGVSLTHDGRSYFVKGIARRYRQLFTNDGLYMEAVMVLENEQLQCADSETEDKAKEKEILRTVYWTIVNKKDTFLNII